MKVQLFGARLKISDSTHCKILLDQSVLLVVLFRLLFRLPGILEFLLQLIFKLHLQLFHFVAALVQDLNLVCSWSYFLLGIRHHTGLLWTRHLFLLTDGYTAAQFLLHFLDPLLPFSLLDPGPFLLHVGLLSLGHSELATTIQEYIQVVYFLAGETELETGLIFDDLGDAGAPTDFLHLLLPAFHEGHAPDDGGDADSRLDEVPALGQGGLVNLGPELEPPAQVDLGLLAPADKQLSAVLAPPLVSISLTALLLCRSLTLVPVSDLPLLLLRRHPEHGRYPEVLLPDLLHLLAILLNGPVLIALHLHAHDLAQQIPPQHPTGRLVPCCEYINVVLMLVSILLQFVIGHVAQVPQDCPVRQSGQSGFGNAGGAGGVLGEPVQSVLGQFLVLVHVVVVEVAHASTQKYRIELYYDMYIEGMHRIDSRISFYFQVHVLKNIRNGPKFQWPFSMIYLITVFALLMQISQSVMPALFIGHGSPTNALQLNKYTRSWAKLAKSLPKPKAILVVSAHWMTQGVQVTAMAQPPTIHDFGGFSQALHKMEYPAPGNPQLAARIKQQLGQFNVKLDQKWGLDHGSWSILVHIYPKADVPVLQLSLNQAFSEREHFQFAGRLSWLRNEGVLIMASGNIVHNLRLIDWDRPNGGHQWAEIVRSKSNEYIKGAEYEKLINYKQNGQEFIKAINSAQHYLPLLYILGLRGKDEPVSFFNDDLMMGSLSMTSVVVGGSASFDQL